MIEVVTAKSLKNVSSRSVQLENAVRMATEGKKIKPLEECKYFNSELYKVCMYTSLLERGYRKEDALQRMEYHGVKIDNLESLPDKPLGDGLESYLEQKVSGNRRNNIQRDFDSILITATCAGYGFKELG